VFLRDVPVRQPSSCAPLLGRFLFSSLVETLLVLIDPWMFFFEVFVRASLFVTKHGYLFILFCILELFTFLLIILFLFPFLFFTLLVFTKTLV